MCEQYYGVLWGEKNLTTSKKYMFEEETLPINAQKTKMMLTIINISMAVRPSALGMLLVRLLKMLTRTRKTVTRTSIRPGTLSGGTKKLRGIH